MAGRDGVERIGFLAPMQVELNPLVRNLSLRKTVVGGQVLYRGAVGGTEVVAMLAGVGPAAATQATNRLLGTGPLDQVVVVGVAGGIDPALRLGDLVVPEVVLDATSGAEYRPSPRAEVTPSGVLITTEGLTVDGDSAEELRTRGVVAVDMETAAVAAVCHRAGISWSVYRAISDIVGEGIVDDAVLHLVRTDGSLDVGAVARFLVTRPWRIPHLFRLAQGSKAATAAAAGAAVGECPRHDLH